MIIGIIFSFGFLVGQALFDPGKLFRGHERCEKVDQGGSQLPVVGRETDLPSECQQGREFDGIQVGPVEVEGPFAGSCQHFDTVPQVGDTGVTRSRILTVGNDINFNHSGTVGPAPAPFLLQFVQHSIHGIKEGGIAIRTEIRCFQQFRFSRRQSGINPPQAVSDERDAQCISCFRRSQGCFPGGQDMCVAGIYDILLDVFHGSAGIDEQLDDPCFRVVHGCF